MRVAIVHDWLYVIGGAERVLREFLRLYPGADVFTLFDALTVNRRRPVRKRVTLAITRSPARCVCT